MLNPLAIMIAPNGAIKNKTHHPNIPITEEEIAIEARACAAAGAQAIHMHVRDEKGYHSLEASRYLSAIAAVRKAAGPNLVVQITTEAVGQFKPHEQIATIRAVQPEAVSIAVKELVPDSSYEKQAAELYCWASLSGIAVQHIIYSVSEFQHLLALIARGVVPGDRHSIIFQLWRYVEGRQSDPSQLLPFLQIMRENGGEKRFDWFTCGFGANETQALVVAAALKGHCRVGFENSFINSDGSLASSNTARFMNLNKALCSNHRPRASRSETLRVLGHSATY
jgi:3-keto-5-aminohexanoate cleavage enzyme